MTVHIEKTAYFLGVPLSKARNVLRAWRYRSSRYLDEFVFRWNPRRHMKSSFDTLLGIAANLPHAGYQNFVDQTV